MLIAWTDPSTAAKLQGQIVGLGGGQAVTTNGEQRLVTGIVFLDAPELSLMAQRPDGAAQVHAVMLHELGHLVGLQHVGDSASIMYPTSSADVLDYSSGDLRGLAAAGRGPCSRFR